MAAKAKSNNGANSASVEDPPKSGRSGKSNRTGAKKAPKKAGASTRTRRSSATPGAATNLVIVESPAKARTIERILGESYVVIASQGHVRDLPKGKLGVSIEAGFEPSYTVPKDKQSIVQEIKALGERSSSIYLATDPDREGEAISWHLVKAAAWDSAKIPMRRVVFHEITQDAVKAAFEHPRDIDMELVNSQQARRILDRLVGYQISPLLWRKVQRGLSAGRVQSVALRTGGRPGEGDRGLHSQRILDDGGTATKEGSHQGRQRGTIHCFAPLSQGTARKARYTR